MSNSPVHARDRDTQNCQENFIRTGPRNCGTHQCHGVSECCLCHARLIVCGMKTQNRYCALLYPERIESRILQQLMAIAFTLNAGGGIISIEKGVLWVLAAKRFLWQSSQGSKNQDLRNQGLQTIGDRVKVCSLYTDTLQTPWRFCLRQ